MGYMSGLLFIARVAGACYVYRYLAHYGRKSRDVGSDPLRKCGPLRMITAPP